MVSSQPVLLFVAAEPREFGGLVKHCKAVAKLAWPVRWARMGELNGRRIVMLANGAGALRAARAVDSALEREKPRAVVSTGFCGALEDSLRVGDIFVASGIRAGDARFTPRLPASGRAHRLGVLASIGRIAQTAAEKRELRALGASAVEMEAAGVAGRVQEHDLPLYCIRAVTDLWNESFENDFNAALRPDGQFATMQILGSVMRRPGSRLPELVRLHRRCALAARNLGEFFADCRF